MASTSQHHTILQENHQPKQLQTMNQIVTTGRSRSSKNVQKKNKKPQRGMGVEQLERLRVQDQIKNHHYYSNNFPNFTNVSSFSNGASATATGVAAADPGIYCNSILNSSPVVHFPKYCVSSNDFLVQQKVVNTGLIRSNISTTCTVPNVPAVPFGDQFSHDHHQFYSQIGQSTFATSKHSTEKSKVRYSSIQNLFSSSNNNNSCFSNHCPSCNKKKRMIDGDEMSIPMEDIIRTKEASGTKPFFHSYSIPSRLEKGVEIMAIHRKGSSFAYEEGGVVMEYDFFPEKTGSSSSNKSTKHTSCFGNMMIMSSNNSPESSSVAAAAAVGNINGEGSSVTTISWAAPDTITPTSSIDLSLKLSY